MILDTGEVRKVEFKVGELPKTFLEVFLLADDLTGGQSCGPVGKGSPVSVRTPSKNSFFILGFCASLAGELTNGATFFTTFACVAKNGPDKEKFPGSKGYYHRKIGTFGTYATDTRKGSNLL